MDRHAGLTLVELTMAMAVFAVLCALVVPNMISWRNRAYMNAAAMTVLAVFQDARLQAVNRNARVWVHFDTARHRYRVHIDDGGGEGRGDGVQNADETVIMDHLPPGVSVASVTRNPVDFNSRGIPYFGTTVTLTDQGHRRRRVILSPSGNSRVEM